ncbi:MAG: hypothetical protein ACE5EY_12980, partial [Anaerolineae bacterium]
MFTATTGLITLLIGLLGLVTLILFARSLLGMVIINEREVGIIIKKFGSRLAPGQLIALKERLRLRGARREPEVLPGPV